MANPRLTRLADLLDEGFAQATAAHEARNAGIALGPAVTFSPKLASELCGHLPVGLTTLHAPPGCGKTGLANQIAAESKCPALVATFEAAPLELLRRHAARVTNTYISKFRTGALTPAEWLTLMQRTIATMPQMYIFDGTRGVVHENDLRENLEVIRGSSRHAFLIVDSVSAWVRQSGNVAANEYENTSAALSCLQSIATDLQVSILAVAEQNRQNRDSDRQDAAAGTRVYEYGSEVVLTLQRDRDAIVDADGTVDVELVLAKNRLGAQGRRIPLRFHGAFMRFEEADTVISMSRRKA